jgi:hypothetical protein
MALLFEIGLLLVVLPWSGFWEQNYFADAWPVVGRVAGHPFVRGAVSGLGLVNLVSGFADLAAILTRRAPAGDSSPEDGRLPQ